MANMKKLEDQKYEEIMAHILNPEKIAIITGSSNTT